MKSLIIIALLTIGGTAFGQVKVTPNKLKINTKGTKIQTPTVSPATPAPGTNSATESNRKRPGGTINTNSNSNAKKPEGEQPKKIEEKK